MTIRAVEEAVAVDDSDDDVDSFRAKNNGWSQIHFNT